jgi:hypothetical protein
VRKLGIDPKRLQKLHDEFRQSFDELLTSGDGKVVPGYHLAGNLDRWKRLSPLHALPLPWGVLPPPDDPTDPHRSCSDRRSSASCSASRRRPATISASTAN